MAYAIVRTDNLKATKDGNILSGRFYDGASTAAIENGNLVVASELLDSSANREIFKCTAPSAITDTQVYLVGSPELIYDETKHYSLGDFRNEAGENITLLGLSAGDFVSVSDEAIIAIDDTDDIPAKGSYVTITAGSTKWTEKASLGGTESVYGKIIARELFKKDVYLNLIKIIKAN